MTANEFLKEQLRKRFGDNAGFLFSFALDPMSVPEPKMSLDAQADFESIVREWASMDEEIDEDAEVLDLAANAMAGRVEDDAARAEALAQFHASQATNRLPTSDEMAYFLGRQF